MESFNPSKLGEPTKMCQIEMKNTSWFISNLNYIWQSHCTLLIMLTFNIPIDSHLIL